MSKSRHTEAQIIAALKQVEPGRTTEDLAREQGVSKPTIYTWKAKYGGMEVSEAEEVKHLRDENSRLKKLIADLRLNKDIGNPWICAQKEGIARWHLKQCENEPWSCVI